MTTNYGQNGSNPLESTTPIFGITQIGITADKGLMNLSTNTSKDRSAIPVERPEEGMWDIGMGDIIISKNEEVFRKMFKMMTQLTGDRIYGKALGVGQTGNLPVSDDLLNDDFYKNASPRDKESMRRQFVLRYMHFLGVSQDSWRKAQGPDKTADQDGLMVIIHGLVSVLLFTERPLRPGALLVLDLIPTQQVGRAGSTRYMSQGPERYPATLREHDPHSPTEWIRRDGLDLIARLEEQRRTNINTGTRILNIVSARNSSASLLLDGQRNAGSIVVGITGIICKFLSGAPSTMNAEQLMNLLLTGLDTDLATDLHKISTSKSVKANIDDYKTFAQEMVLDLARATFEDKDKNNYIKTATNPAKAKTIMANGLELFLYGAQDTAASTNRIIGKNIQTLLPKHNKASTGVYTNDVFVSS